MVWLYCIFGLLHVPGNNNPVGIDVKKNSNETMPFHPYMVMKDFLALLAFLIIFLWFVFFAPNVLGHPDNYIEANPSSNTITYSS